MSNSSYPTLFDVWTETSSRMFDSVMEANRAAMDAFAAPGTDGDHAESATERRVEPAGDLPGWETQLDVDGQLSVGDAVRFSKTLSEEDVERFALASGDTNPLHLDEEWAEDTRFSGRIVHGTLAAGLISAALARLPGGVVYLSQDLEFRAPVRIDDRVTAEVEIVEDLGGGRYRLRTTVETDTDLVIDGEAVVLIED
ncbi:MaoC family dehydratase [Natronomonas gomsonensis]|jgi:3-hydroxybutyryl-CoA dehydratase|uniref:MaoC family dehydratase n=1 Tax=Natronomonas gomsonensis TaxID=1046043 RepID=UPI0020CA63DC|nr:MaoC family dehydratase [Natronomonas gomsonensis]